jgi:hypothetical protein
MNLRGAASNGAGARNESSVLFSLSALVEKGNATQEAQSTEDSGVIDLKAIAAAAGKPASTSLATLTTADVALFPFEMPAAQPAQERAPEAIAAAPQADAAPQRRSRARLVGAVVVVLLAIGAAGFAGAQMKPAHTAAVDLNSAMRHAADVVALIPPKPIAPAPAPVDPGQKATSPQGSTKPGVSSRQAPPGSQTPGSQTKETPAQTTGGAQTGGAQTGGAKPPGPPCDLMCQMQRATKK